MHSDGCPCPGCYVQTHNRCTKRGENKRYCDPEDENMCYTCNLYHQNEDLQKRVDEYKENYEKGYLLGTHIMNSPEAIAKLPIWIKDLIAFQKNIVKQYGDKDRIKEIAESTLGVEDPDNENLPEGKGVVRENHISLKYFGDKVDRQVHDAEMNLLKEEYQKKLKQANENIDKKLDERYEFFKAKKETRCIERLQRRIKGEYPFNFINL